MEKKVLVAYATKYGATQEIAEKIGLVLQDAGFDCDVLDVDRVRDPDLYCAVVLGSAVYIGGWRKEAVKFIEENERLLAQRPVWIYSSGPTGEGDAVELLNGWKFPEKLAPVIDRIKPREVVVFHGNVDVEKLNFLEKFAIKNVKSPVGDFRNWDEITEWAQAIADALVQLDIGMS